MALNVQFKVPGKPLWWAIGIGFALPVYVITGFALVRTGVFHTGRAPLSADGIKAVWAFLGAAIASVVTAFGLLVTHSHNQRTLLLQREIAGRAEQAAWEASERQRMAQDETDRRLKLDSATNMLALLSNQGPNATRSAIAGALSALVHLEHPIIAMRCLQAAWGDGAVDGGTAAWLISEVYENGSDEARIEAADILRDYAAQLTETPRPGLLSWPACLDRHWPPVNSTEARTNIVLAALETLMSQERTWWVDGWDRFTALFDEVVKNDLVDELRASAAEAVLILTQGAPEDYSIEYGNGWKLFSEMRERAERCVHATDQRIFAVTSALERLADWLALPAA